ncbi:18701_t:CDS:2 [Racocetra persica]|uniref:18701_t:CDS:1 n=1 Tax=Racocetra persica TaxID=160502 RepID=A0ACA9L1L3_9GLOM|nr:18701_t:CDS:2 [Racocetra persica]
MRDDVEFAKINDNNTVTTFINNNQGSESIDNQGSESIDDDDQSSESIDDDQDSINKCSLCSQNFLVPLPAHLQQLQTLNIVDQFEICQFHTAEATIVPDGLSKNYPKVIDFKQLPERVKNLYPELWMIITKKAESIFRNTAIENQAARIPLIEKFEKFQSGYYGFKGMHIILRTLGTFFIESKKLSSNMIYPLSPMEYLVEVLVPETAIRLIARD